MAPKLNRRRALFVLEKIDEILQWERQTEQERDTRFVELGRYLCEVRAGQYWRVDNLKSFDEFLEKKFPESRRKAYYLMAIHEQLPRQTHHELKQVGWTKAAELAKVARRDGQKFDCATWLHKAQELPKEEFKREVERHLTGKESEPWEMLYFKVYKSQLAVIEQALETASLMLGGQKARGDHYCRTPSSRSSCCGSRRRHEISRPKTTQAALGPRVLSRALPASTRARWLAMPTMWEFDRSAGSSYEAAQPTRRGSGGESHHPLQCVPSGSPFRCRDFEIGTDDVFARCKLAVAIIPLTSPTTSCPNRAVLSNSRDCLSSLAKCREGA